MIRPLLIALSVSTLAASSLAAGAPALAREDSMMMAKMDCAKAPEMLNSAQKMGYNAASFGSGVGPIDRIELPSIIDREKGTGMMYKVEAECGKDPKMKAMAAKMAAESDARVKMLESMMPDKKM
jgi:phosphosulfolactate synthase (CoM biosynthesis protein A)